MLVFILFVFAAFLALILMAGPLFPQAFVADHATLATANTNRDFSAGTIVTLATGVAGGKPITHILISITATIAADTEIGLALDNGSIKIPIGAIPIQAYTPTAREPNRVFMAPLPGGPVALPTTSDLLLGRIHTTDTIKARPASLKFQ